MKILKSWLKDYIGNDISDQRLEEILLFAGIEVESVEKTIDDNIIVTRIDKILKHPNADKLQIAEVFDGTKTIKVVCGATNIEVGLVVPLALPGAKIQGQELKAAVIRGEESFGMLCAEDELGIGNDHSGILILSDDWELGSSINQHIESDSIYDLSLTANRGDCLSHIGIAREIAAYENLSVKKEPIKISRSDPDHASTKISIKILDENLCQQYFSRVIKGVKIGPSPEWLKNRLISCGAKPINNVVDVTNYIMLDLGHPMHAFDQQKIAGESIVVRNAKKNEDIVTLDGEIRNLNTETLVIADKEKAIAIAGIMGGKNSEVDDNTETIVLEAAEFDRKSIRKTSKTLKLSTEASYRFERGIDSSSIEYAINKAADLIAKVSGGRVMSGIVSAGVKPEKLTVKIEYEKINSLLGISKTEDEINHILRQLGFSVTNDKAGVPSWRHDILFWQDLAEEIGRVIGYDKISPINLSSISKISKSSYYRSEFIKDILIGEGYCETMNYPFLSEKDLTSANLNSDSLLEVANPLQPENRYLRNSLIPGMLKNLAISSAFDTVKIFEIGHIFSKTREDQSLSMISTVKDMNIFQSEIDLLSQALKINLGLFKIRQLTANELNSYKIKRGVVFIAELNLSKIFQNASVDQKLEIKKYQTESIYRGVSKYPSMTRDLAFVVDKSVKASEISNDIYQLSELVNRVELFDEFASDKLGVGKKNLAFHIFLQSFESTMKDSQAEEIVKNIVEKISKKFKAKLRA